MGGSKGKEQKFDLSKVNSFRNLLSSLNFRNKLFFEKDLTNRLGTNFYKIAVYTEGGVLLNPAKLVRAMIETIPLNVDLFENSPLLSWKKYNGKVVCNFKLHNIKTEKIMLDIFIIA